jgi:hypothetical protein
VAIAPRLARSVLLSALALLVGIGAVLSLGQTPAHAATTGTVSGVVTLGSVPVGPDVEVHLYPAYPTTGDQVVVTTDVDSHYVFTDVPNGNYNMVIQSTSEYPTAFVRIFTLTNAVSSKVIDIPIAPFPTGISSVVGTLVDAVSGLPIEDATADFRGNNQAKDTEIHTGPDGAFAIHDLPAGSYTMYLGAAGYVGQQLSLEVGTGEEVNASTGLVLGDSEIGGRVLDEEGQPLPDMSIDIVSDSDPTQHDNAQTAEDGTFIRQGLAAGGYTVSLGGIWTDWVETSVHVVIAAGTPGDVELTAVARVLTTISGNINNAGGANLSGICTELWDLDLPADVPDRIVAGADETTSNGDFVVTRVGAGNYALHFADCSTRTPGFASTFLGGVPSVNSSGLQIIHVEEGTPVTGISINLKPGAAISGYVNLLSGDGVTDFPATRGVATAVFQKIDGAWEELSHAGSFAGYGDPGSFTVRGLPAGSYRIMFTDSGSPAYIRYKDQFWPAASTVDTATTITLTSGQSRTGVNATVAVPTPATAPVPSDDSKLTGYQEDIIDAPDAAKQGDKVTVDVGADHAGEWVSVWGHSTPTAMSSSWVRVGKSGKVSVSVPGSMVTGDHKIVVQNATNGVLGWSDLALANGPYPATEPGSVTVDSAALTLHAITTDFPASTSITGYQWFRGNTAIPGKTSADYTLTPADQGALLKVQVSATIPGYATTTRSSTPAIYSLVRADGALSISGVPRLDRPLHAENTLTYSLLGSTVTPTLEYQWLRNGVAIALDSTDDTYMPKVADIGKKLTVRVTATVPGRLPVVTVSAATAAIGKGLFTPVAMPPEISVTYAPVTYFADLFATGMSADHFAYQWLRDGASIPGATGDTYLPGDADWGKTVTVRMTMTKANYETAVVTFAPRADSLVPTPARPQILGGVGVGEHLVVGDRSYQRPAAYVVPDETYQWYVGSVPVATTREYVVAAADKGKTITVKVTAVDPDGMSIRSVSTSLPTQVVAQFAMGSVDLDPATATGAATLVAPNSGITYPANPKVTYQWFRGGIAVAQQTKSTYLLTTADYGKAVWVRLTISLPTWTTVVKDSPALDYSIRQDSIPTLETTAWQVGLPAHVTGQSYFNKDEASFVPTLSYQWLRNGVAIANAHSATYTPVAADYTKKLSLRITAKADGYVPFVYTTLPGGVVAKGVTTSVPDVQVQMTTPGTLVASLVPGSLSPASPDPVLKYVWMRGPTTITGATAPTYKLTAADYGKSISVKVTVTRANFTVPTVALPATPGVDYSIVPDGLPAIDDLTPQVGDVLHVTQPGCTQSGGPVACSVAGYQWSVGGVKVATPAGTAASFTLPLSALNKTVSVSVRYGTGVFAGPAQASAATPPVAAGETAGLAYAAIVRTITPAGLAATVDAGEIVPATPAPTYTYQWYKRSPLSGPSDWILITGATKVNYAFTANDRGALFMVAVTMHRAGFIEPEVVLGADPDLGDVADPSSSFYWSDWNSTGWVRGTSHAVIGEVATPEPITFTEWDGVTPVAVTEKCQWFNDHGIITGATSCSYPVTAAQRGRCLYVQYSVTAPGRLGLTGKSTACIPVFEGTIVPSTPPAIGPQAPIVGDTLTITDPATWTTAVGAFVPTASELRYQWYRGATIIDGATSATYAAVAADVGYALHVKVFADRDLYYTGEASSNETAVVPTP